MVRVIALLLLSTTVLADEPLPTQANEPLPLSWFGSYLPGYVVPCDTQEGSCLDITKLAQDTLWRDSTGFVCNNGAVTHKYTLWDMYAWMRGQWPTITPITEEDRSVCG